MLSSFRGLVSAAALLLIPVLFPLLSHAAGARDLVAIDADIPDRSELIRGLAPGIDVLILDGRTDALGQIARAVAGRSDLGALHVISHGLPGRIAFASGRIGTGELNDRARELRAIGAALGRRGAMLLYGCSIADGDAGASFLTALSSAIGRPVAASVDPTGPARLGGDWTLERATAGLEPSSINTALPIRPEALESLPTLLQAPVITQEPSDQTICSLELAVFRVGVTGWNYPALWEIKMPNGNWQTLHGAFADSLRITDVSRNDGIQYRATFSNSRGSVTTRAVTLHINPAPEITLNPAPQQVCLGDTVTYRASAVEYTSLQWQRRNFGTWSDIQGATDSVYRFVPTGADEDAGFRVIARHSRCTIADTSASAELQVHLPPTFVTPIPEIRQYYRDTTFRAGASAIRYFHQISGVGLPTYQISDDGGATWYESPNGGLLMFTATEADNGKMWRTKAETNCFTRYSDTGHIAVISNPRVTTQPQNQTVCSGDTAVFTAAGGGLPAPAIRWQVSTNGGTNWSDMPGEVSTTLRVPVDSSLDGRTYRAVFSSTSGPDANSNAATLTMARPAAFLNRDLRDTTMTNGRLFSFGVTFTGTPTPTVTWQYKPPCQDWITVPGATGATLTDTAEQALNGALVRAVVTGNCGPAIISDTATLTVISPPTITRQPANMYFCSADTVKVIAGVRGDEPMSTTWQESTDNGGTWSTIPGATSDTLKVFTTPAVSGRRYRVIYNNGIGSPVTSNAATLTAAVATQIIQQPADTVVTNGGFVNLMVRVTGTPKPVNYWERQNGATWTRYTINRTDSVYRFQVYTSMNGWRFRAVVANACGDSIRSNIVTIHVGAGTFVTADPVNDTACAGGAATFTARGLAPGGVIPSVQWQQSTDNGANWSDRVGDTATTLTFTAHDSLDGRLYRAVFANAAGSPVASAAASLTVGAPTAVARQPRDTTIGAGATATFAVSLTGSPRPRIRWQQSAGGGAWSDVAGAVDSVLSVEASPAVDGRSYRAVLSSACGDPVVTDSARLTVLSAPSVTLDPVNAATCGGGNVAFTAAATGNPAPGVMWQESTDEGATWSDRTGDTQPRLELAADSTMNRRKYRAIFTNINGVSDTTSAATLSVGSGAAPTSEPRDTTVNIGDVVRFSVSFGGAPVPALTWQQSTDDGATWRDIPCSNDTILTFAATAAHDGRRYRVLMPSPCGPPAGSAAAILRVMTPPRVTTHPVADTACVGDTVTFSAAASGTPTPAARWQHSTDGGATWSDVSADTAWTLRLPATVAMDGRRYRAIFSNGGPLRDTTGAASLMVGMATSIVTEPTSTGVCLGDTARFSVAFTGHPAPTIRWQLSTDSGINWSDIQGAVDTVLAFAADTSMHGNRYRALISNACGAPVPSAGVGLSVSVPTQITLGPVSASICTGDSLTLSVGATGYPTPVPQWQVSSDGGTTWENLVGRNSDTLRLAIISDMDGQFYRALFPNPCGDTLETNSAVLDVHAPARVVSEPADTVICDTSGAEVTFAAEALGNPIPTARWQVSVDGGVSFTDIPDQREFSYTLHPGYAESGNRYRAIFTTDCGVPDTSRAAVLTVGAAPEIARQPAPQQVCTGYAATFSVAAVSAGGTAPTYQWRRNGTPIPGARDSAYVTPPVTRADSGSVYDVIVTSCFRSDTSRTAMLVVTPPARMEVSVQPKHIYATDHSLKTIEAEIVVTGGCSPEVALHSIVSSEADGGVAAGDLSGDIVADSLGISPPERSFQLRAESVTMAGRVYTVIYRLTDGAYITYDTLWIPAVPVGSSLGSLIEAAGVSLSDPQPNPVRDSTRIDWTFDVNCGIRLVLYRLDGTMVTQLVPNWLGTSGSKTWDGRDASGNLVPDGTYVYVIKGCGRVKSGVMTILR